MGDIYLVKACVFVVKVARRYMMPIVPSTVLQVTIIGVVRDDLVLGHMVTRPILIIPVSKLKNNFGRFASQRRVAALSCYRWPHVLEYHHVLSRHLFFVPTFL